MVGVLLDGLPQHLDQVGRGALYALRDGEAAKSRGHEQRLPDVEQGCLELRLLPVENRDLEALQNHRGRLDTAADGAR